MSFEVSSLKINELSKILDLKAPTVSKKFKEMEEPRVEKRNNRIVGISPDEIERYFRERGHEHLFKTTIFLVNSTVGGVSKTSSSVGLLGALRRITAINNLEDPSKKKVCIYLDLDSQASGSGTVLGSPVPDGEPVLIDYFESRASLDDILRKVSDEQEIYCIGSNLNNIYLDKALSTPKAMKESMKKLLEELIEKFGEGTRIVIDSAPQLSLAVSSTVCALSQFIAEGRDYTTGLVCPIRPDDYGLKGAKYSYSEAKQITSTFNLPEVPTHCFISAFDKRLKVGLEVMRNLLKDDLLSNHVSPVMVRYSSEISKANMNKESIFSGKMTNATSDYQDLALYLLGYEGQSGQA